MKTKFPNRREIKILGLPLLLIGAGGVLFTVQEKKRIERESGPLRTVVTSVKMEEITPFEAWQGYSHKVTVEGELWGNSQIPEGYKSNSIYSRLTSEVFLSGKSQGENRKVGIGKRVSDASNIYSVDDSPLVSVYDWDSTKVRGYRTFLIRRQYFGKSDLKLSGIVRIQQEAYKQREDLSDNLPSGWEFPDKRANHMFIQRSSLAAPFSIEIPNTNVREVDKAAPKVLASGKNSLSPRSERTGMFEGEGETQIWAKLKPWSKDRGRLFVGPTEILDKDNLPIELPKNKRGWERNIRFSNSRIYKDGSIELIKNIPVWDIPHSHGPLTYRTWISFDQSWPVEIRIPIRNESDIKIPSLLKLESITVAGSNVNVRVKYLGKLRLISSGSQGFLDDRKHHVELPSQENYPQKALGSDEARLISNWSQHLTAANGKEYWFDNAVKVQSVTEITPANYEIVYATNALSALKKGETMKFSAHVGIEGDGFIPIETKITKR